MRHLCNVLLPAVFLFASCNNYDLVNKLENPSGGATTKPAEPGKLYAFVTPTVTAGNMSGLTSSGSCTGDGLTRADCECNALAQAGGLKRDANSVFVAWLSTSSDNMLCRIQGSSGSGCTLPAGGKPWYNTANQIIANDFADLFDGSLTGPLAYSQAGVAIPGGDFAWTGTAAAGTNIATTDCSGWTSTSGVPELGTVGATNSTWSNGATSGCSSSTFHIYCFAVP